MNKKIKYHLHKYIFYDLLAIIIFVIFTTTLISLKYSIDENNKATYDYTRFDYYINIVYKNKPELFFFDEEGKYELNLEEIQQALGNVYFSIPMTSSLDECVGNVIVKKEDNNLTFDYSHICEMRDY
ncbi:MAG: hypothetical protein PHN42_01845 [Bacilli bacterium]|nr:hypothetical protein [Bacilli bacterium]